MIHGAMDDRPLACADGACGPQTQPTRDVMEPGRRVGASRSLTRSVSLAGKRGRGRAPPVHG